MEFGLLPRLRHSRPRIGAPLLVMAVLAPALRCPPPAATAALRWAVRSGAAPPPSPFEKIRRSSGQARCSDGWGAPDAGRAGAALDAALEASGRYEALPSEFEPLGPRGCALLEHELSLELLVGYEAMLARARRELEVCHPGDHVLFSVFVFEPGDTSEKLIAELAAAARRGVRITLRTDTSAFSWFTRFCEGTTTLIDRLQDLSQSMPEHVAFEPPDFPTHVKLLLFRRRGQADVAIFGGINVGDRFRSWRDFSVVVSGDRGVDALLESLDWPRPQRGPGEALGLRRLQFVTNKPDAWDWPAWLLRRPFAGVFDLGARMERFFADEGLVRYRVVASYIDDSGLELLACALSRGASVQLVLPRMPNVYKDRRS
ncbi:unnamed protein product [Prorocentrum cordatum]|uniref:CDP-diacylglycerol--glycerol-3-phosphate 3-phosphatidyltransferase n=1 Tax=Prorocentrum cordatum TaxID=2364126 RepID=A0ABN9T7T4_9DINO|nr:unnamed protein product [Polarella glacialis]